MNRMITTDRYATAFAKLNQLGQKAFIPFTVLGWPDAESSFQIIKTMIESGASALELGLAFSDPVADGPIIQKASHECVSSGFTTNDAFKLVQRIRQTNDQIPIGLLTYYNLVLAKGRESFFQSAQEAGVDGILIADLPIENVEEVFPFAEKHGVRLIFLVSPVTTAERLKKIVSKAGAFLYLISRLGVTGTHDRETEKDQALIKLVTQIRTLSKLPVCAGFGISAPRHARTMFALGLDGIITGAKIVEIVQSASPTVLKADLQTYIKQMFEACKDHSP